MDPSIEQELRQKLTRLRKELVTRIHKEIRELPGEMTNEGHDFLKRHIDDRAAFA